MAKAVAVILLNWNRLEYTSACINSIRKFCNPDLYDIIVADNGSIDQSLDFLESHFPDIIFIDNKTNLGFSEGNNRALNISIVEGYLYSLVLNNDTVIEQDFLSNLVDYLDNNDNVAAVQPAIYNLPQKYKLWNGGSYFNKFFGIPYSKTNNKRQNSSNPQKVDWLTGCCMLIRNTALKKSGLFNKHYFLYYEDVELSFRLKKNYGDLYYLPNVKIYHEAGVSSKNVANKEGNLNPIIHYYLSRNNIWLLRKYGDIRLFPFGILYHIAYYMLVLVYFVFRRRFEKAKNLFEGLKQGFKTPLSKIYGDSFE